MTTPIAVGTKVRALVEPDLDRVGRVSDVFADFGKNGFTVVFDDDGEQVDFFDYEIEVIE